MFVAYCECTCVCVCGEGGHHSCLTNIFFYFLFLLFSKRGKIDDFLLASLYLERDIILKYGNVLGGGNSFLCKS